MSDFLETDSTDSSNKNEMETNSTNRKESRLEEICFHKGLAFEIIPFLKMFELIPLEFVNKLFCYRIRSSEQLWRCNEYLLCRFLSCTFILCTQSTLF